MVVSAKFKTSENYLDKINVRINPAFQRAEDISSWQ